LLLSSVAYKTVWLRRTTIHFVWQHAMQTAREAGFEHLLIESEPDAQAFRRAMEAERVGERESSVQPGRFLPLLRVSLAGQAQKSIYR
jgi:hypothetical protein